MINIYQLHTNPDQLKGYDQAYEKIPKFVWEQYEDQPDQLKKRKDILAQDPETAYQYAWLVLDDRFPEGEDAIAQSSLYAYLYASDILLDRFPEGEDAIAQNQYNAFYYAINILTDRFLKGESAIKQDQKLWNKYKQYFQLSESG